MLHVRTMGTAIIETPVGRLGPEAERIFALALVLALSPGRNWSRDELCDLIWPDAAERNARQNLRQALYRLRKLGVEADAGARYVKLNERATTDGLTPDSSVENNAALLLGEPTAIGPYLGGYEPDFSDALRDWVGARRFEGNAETRRRVLECIGQQRSKLNWTSVETLGRIALSIDPYNEEATLARAEALAMLGGKVDAIELLDRYKSDVEHVDRKLAIPAAVLRRRVSESFPERRSDEGGRQRLVGRESILKDAHEALCAAKQESGSVSCYVGPGGIGKTRILEEILGNAALMGFGHARFNSQPVDRARAYSAPSALITQLLELPGALACNPRTLALLRRVTNPESMSAESTAISTDATVVNQVIQGAILELVSNIAEEIPIAICIDDAQYLDSASVNTIAGLCEEVGRMACVILLAQRMYDHDLPTHTGIGTHASYHRIPRLSDTDASALADAFCTEGMEPEPSVRELAARYGDGIPLLIQAVASHAYRTGDMSPPPSVRHILQGRLTGLAGDPLRILQLCASLGRHASITRLGRLMAVSPNELTDAIAEVEAKGLADWRSSRLVPRHELYADGAIELLGPGATAALHYGIAQDLETFPAGGDGAIHWDLLYHWAAAGDSEKAAHHASACVASLLRLGLPDHAIEVLKSRQGTAISYPMRQLLRDQMATALSEAGRWDQVLELVDPPSLILGALALEPTNAHVDVAWARFKLGAPSMQVIDALMKVLCDPSSSQETKLNAGFQGLRIADVDGLPDSLVTIYSALCESGSIAHDGIRSQACRLIYHTSAGDLTAAYAGLAKWLEDSDRTGDPLAHARGLRFASVVYTRCGDHTAALSALEHAYSIAIELQSPYLRLITSSRGIEAAMDHEIASAAIWYERLLRDVEASPKGSEADDFVFLPTQYMVLAGLEPGPTRSLPHLIARLNTLATSRKRGHALAVAMHRALASSEYGSLSDLLSQTRLLAPRLTRLGGYDYVAAITYTATAHLLGIEAANRTWQNYLGQRRERHSINPFGQEVPRC